jgi:hypothetical protein
MKYLVLVVLVVLVFGAYPLNAEIVYQRDVNITQVNAYDDLANVAAFIYLNSNHSDCPNGAYLNPSAPNFSSLYSLTLAAFMAKKTVTLQMYNDRVSYGRCEVDSLQVFGG